jgi:16S rRNA (uracil1498-N3)-methyltransferase
VFVADLIRPVLGDDDRHHLARVLRLRPGEEVTGADGAGGWRRFRYCGGGELESVSAVDVAARPVPRLTVAFALTKGERPEWTVQKLVEVGVDCIVPMISARTVVQWGGEKASRNSERLRTVARAAAMQSRRRWLPVVNDVQPFASVVAGVCGGAALAALGGAAPSLTRPTILVGPEGGWDESELASGLPLVGLGPTVLRAETAAMAAGVLLAALRAGVVDGRQDDGS